MGSWAAISLLWVGSLLTQLGPDPMGGGPASLPAPIYTRQTTFAIPFRLDQTRSLGGASLDVELHVSVDGGATWQPAGRVPAEKKQFVFRAPQDGAYLFYVRTVDRSGRAPLNNPPAPELHVVVDTRPPVLELAAELGPSGELVAQWRIDDDHLRADGLKLEYQAGDAQAAWQLVAVDPIPLEDGRREYIGRATWWPSTPGASLTVRAELLDLAGNRSVSQVLAKSPDAGALAGSPEGTGRVSPPLGTPPVAAPPSDGRWPADRLADAPLGSAGQHPFEELPGPGRAVADRPQPRGRFTSSQDDAEAVPPPPPLGDNGRPRASTDVVSTELPSPTTDDEAPESPAPRADDSLSEGPGPRATPTGRPRPRTRTEARRSVIDLALLPPGELPHMVRSRRFELDYEVDEVGPSGVARVELWGTSDGGQTWSSYGIDEDRESPLLATVEGEGLYGFRISVSSGSGLGGRPPEEGAEPDLWVGVDLTRPFGRLVSADPAAEDPTGALEIRWEAEDEMLAERPISLAFADDVSGPWTPLASELENSGRFVWRLDNQVPEQVYLRLEVLDEAGNLQVVESRDPIAIDRLRPKGRIRQVRPIQPAE